MVFVDQNHGDDKNDDNGEEEEKEKRVHRSYSKKDEEGL